MGCGEPTSAERIADTMRRTEDIRGLDAVGPVPYRFLPADVAFDDILDDYVEQDRSAFELIEDGFDADTVQRVLRLTDLAEYKRRQYPPGTKISARAFGRDRRQPITNRWREQLRVPQTD